jgi:iron complex transport system permease protein
MSRRRAWLVHLLWIAPLAAFVGSLLVGRYPLSFASLLQGLGEGSTSLAGSILWRVRLPRAIAAGLVGANLGLTGALFQGVFRNPLVDSRILGVSSGAAFGAALALLVGSPAAVQGGAFLSGLAAVGLLLLLGARFGFSPLVLVVTGVLVGAFFSSLLGLVTYVADPLRTLPAITFWLLGGLGGTRWGDLVPVAAVSTPGLLLLLALRWRLNLLSLSDAEAGALGVNAKVFRPLAVAAGTLLVSASVSISGMIGWVGLIVPHVGRAIVGSDQAKLLPASAALGATTLLVLDAIARSALPGEIPLGVLTGIVGVPAFLAVLRVFLRRRGEAR